MTALCKSCGKPFLPAHGLGGSCSMFLTSGPIDEYRAEIASLKERLAEGTGHLSAIFAHFNARGYNDRAPGHCHHVAKRWDDTDLPCEWCEQWETARAFLQQQEQQP